MRSTHVIRTPDQRLRIFVSSTLQELAAERLATRTALERLHLAPVMFELGARPHPPRDLYRAYLEQSDVFLGLYWERYGWVAPDETVSGLEDEYNLCPPDLPRLLYIKSPAKNRDPELALLLERIREDDRAAYRYFETAKELARLVEADLATLLAERFEQSRAVLTADVASETDRVVEPVRLPVQLTDLIGRGGDLGAIQRMLESGERLVTLLGPGGIGKSRLAIAAARAAALRSPMARSSSTSPPYTTPTAFRTRLRRRLAFGTPVTHQSWRNWSLHSASATSCWCSTISNRCLARLRR